MRTEIRRVPQVQRTDYDMVNKVWTLALSSYPTLVLPTDRNAENSTSMILAIKTPKEES